MDIELYLVLLCAGAFIAGFVDAIVGGGGLIQTPLALVLLPNLQVAQVIGSLKIPAFSGTFIASLQYLKRTVIQWKLLIVMMVLAIPSAYAGSALLNYVSNDFMKPVLLVVLTLVAIYTYTKKDFGQHSSKSQSAVQQLLYGVLISITVGFYDGFIGPGTGSFFVLGFIAILGFDFLQASANAKMVNLATNFGSICLFIIKGKMLWHIALPMAACNALGAYFGAKLALSRGNGFIRIFFLVVLIATLSRFAWDVFSGK